jgi:glycosyltransferase involved in cell wall biosynthesis
VKLAIVVQRYGADINGGAEQHARYIAERLAPHHDVDVLTTCARDYVTWANELDAGNEEVHGVTVRRFPVARERDIRVFARRSRLVFEHQHSLNHELQWLDAEGPMSPTMLRYIRHRRTLYDFFLLFSYRYYHAYHVARIAPERSVLVPTAERDAAIGLALFPPVFRGVRAIMFNSVEERAMIQHVSGRVDLPGVVVGVGSDLPENTEPDRFRRQFGITAPFAIYVGRIDENKGCKELFEFFERYCRAMPGDLNLVLIGKSLLPIPSHPRIHHLGFVTDEQKFDAMAAADVLVMPSYYESLSMVTLEAWGLGKPVLVNAKCDVLKGQTIRSNAGLYYDNYAEFAEALHSIVSSQTVKRTLGGKGRQYFEQHYAWPVIDRKYLDMLDRLARGGQPLLSAEPLPNWLERRKRTLPPAADVLAGIPSGAVLA